MKPLLNSESVCELLGVSASTLSRMVRANKIPFLLIGIGKTKWTVRFREDELEAWLNRRARGAVSRKNCNSVDTRDEVSSEVIKNKGVAPVSENG